jgi:hypothetical protein
VRLTPRALQKAGYDYFHKMKLYDESDHFSIEMGLQCVFGFGEDRINAAIEGHVHLVSIVNVHLLSIHPVLPKNQVSESIGIRHLLSAHPTFAIMF